MVTLRKFCPICDALTRHRLQQTQEGVVATCASCGGADMLDDDDLGAVRRRTARSIATLSRFQQSLN